MEEYLVHLVLQFAKNKIRCIWKTRFHSTFLFVSLHKLQREAEINRRKKKSGIDYRRENNPWKEFNFVSVAQQDKTKWSRFYVFFCFSFF